MNNDQLSAAKHALRSQIADRLAQLSPAAIAAKSRLLAEKLIASTWWQEAGLVCLYFAMQKEPATINLLQAARQAHKILAAPRITGDRLVFHDCSDPATGVMQHAFGFMEPHPSAPLVDFKAGYGQILILVPGAAFDRTKNRLGRGKGYYDKFICALHKLQIESIMITKITFAGICFTEQLVPGVPVSATDEPMDVIITDAEIV